MNILIAFQGLANIETLLQFAVQFILGADEQITILANIGYGDDGNPKHVNAVLSEACMRVSMPMAKTIIRKGDPVKNILHEAKSGNFDLVIVRDLQNLGLRRFFRSTRSARIADQTPCPIMIVKGKTGPIQHILMCDSGSPESPLLGSFTAQVVDLLPGEQGVTILHVMSQISAGPGVKGGQLRANADELIETHAPEGDLLERDLNSLEKSGLHPVPKIRHGLVVEEILAEASSGDCDLIIIGAHGKKWEQFLLDDLSRQIIDKADRPVLIVKKI